MLDYLMMQHLPGSIYSDSIYRCQNCGQGPVMAGDGFLMNRCLNCGRYHHATDLVGFDFSWLRSKVSGLWRWIKAWFAPVAIEELNLGCETKGGVK